MKFTPKEIKENVNVSKRSPLKDLTALTGGILLVLLSVYVILGFLVEAMVTKLPHELESKIASHLSSKYLTSALNNKLKSNENRYLNNLLEDLVKELTNSKRKYSVILIPEPTVSNAIALPDGTILIFSKLLKELQSENELSFVLAHELGHYRNRDHLKSIGRGLGFLLISVSLFGVDSSSTNFLLKMIENAEMKFSQKQESNADLFALELINRKYGHVYGATDFFKRMSANDDKSRLNYYFASHPYPLDRVQTISDAIKKKRYIIGTATPLILND